MTITEVINELYLFSTDVLTLEEPVNLDEVVRFENTYSLHLPQDYIELLKVTNGFDLMGTTVHGVGNSLGYSLERLYTREHNEVANPLFNYLVPFSPDGGGNHYCFDTRTLNNDSCNIIFWQHDYLYSEDDQPEVTNTSFAEWVKQVVIDWTLEDYDYNGDER